MCKLNEPFVRCRAKQIYQLNVKNCNIKQKNKDLMIQWDAFIGRISGRLRVNGVEALLQHLPMSLVVTIVFETYEVLNLFIIGSVRKIESTQSTSKHLTN